jgi:NADH-quinone oxidoreductase subunit N
MGFLGKFYILTAGAAAAACPLMIVLVLTSVAGLFYYLRMVVTLYSAPPEHGALIQPLAWSSALVLGLLAILLIWFGVYPAPLLNLIRTAMVGLG